MKLVVFHEFSDDLKRYWMMLEKLSLPHVFQAYDWLSHWEDTIGQHSQNVDPWIAVVLDDMGEPKIIFPFAIRKFLGARILEFFGGAQADYHGPLIDDEFILSNINIELAWELVLKELPNHDVRHFTKLPAYWRIGDNPMLKLLKTTVQDKSYSTVLPKTFDEFRMRQRKKFRGDSNRQRRRLNKLGAVEFLVFDTSDDQSIAALNEMIKQKRKRCRVMKVPDMFSDNMVQTFYRELPEHFQNKSRIHFSVLKLDDEILATHWGAISEDRFYYLMPTITDGKLGVYSPGRLLLEHLVEWCIQNELHVFDFTIGGEDYKRDWCDSEMTLYEHLQIVTPRSLPYVVYTKLRSRARNNEKIWGVVKRIYSLLQHRK